MKDSAKVLIAGLDYAGKTSIMIALNEQKDFIDKVLNLAPTIRVDHIKINFLGGHVIFWDMGGQKEYRELYKKRKEFYFGDADILIYVIDIQDAGRFSESIHYLDSIFNYFRTDEEKIPVVVAFHKSDPGIIDNPEIKQNMDELTEKIKENYPDFEILFQQTSIYDIVSIIKMVSYGLAVLNEDFYELYNLLEEYSMNLDCLGLFLLDQNGMIICKYFKDEIEEDIYSRLEKSVKKHIYELKDKKEKGKAIERKLFEDESEMRSYLHPIKYREEEYYISILLD